MNILFLTMSRIADVSEHDIYQDLIRDFISMGHEVYLVTPCEKRLNKPTKLFESCGCRIVRVKIGNQSNCGFIEKGISLLTLRLYYEKAIKKLIGDVKFDLILYSTPPITIMPIVKKLKKKFSCPTYLMLKDIFPQNAVDLGIIKKGSVIESFFRKQEKALYACSDFIGCMSEANVGFLKEHNNVDNKSIELLPNAVDCEPVKKITDDERIKIRAKYKIPEDKKVIVYGGNLGRPQGIRHLIKCIVEAKKKENFFFLIAGEGTEYDYLSKYIEDNSIENVRLIKILPRAEYFELVGACDVGLVSLDGRFTIPNFPSRLLPYMECALPVLCITDRATDVGDYCEKNGFGWKCYSGDIEDFLGTLDIIDNANLCEMGYISRKCIERDFSAKDCAVRIAEKAGEK